MTREELKEHCEKQIEMCEAWAFAKAEEPGGKIYEEHKLILELLEQEPTTKNDLGVDAVSRADVLKLMQDNWHTHNGDWAMQESMDDIRALPPVTPQEPKTGHWIEEFVDTEGEVRFTCSCCGKYQLFGTDFCYNCGAKMEEAAE